MDELPSPALLLDCCAGRFRVGGRRSLAALSSHRERPDQSAGGSTRSKVVQACWTRRGAHRCRTSRLPVCGRNLLARAGPAGGSERTLAGDREALACWDHARGSRPAHAEAVSIDPEIAEGIESGNSRRKPAGVARTFGGTGHRCPDYGCTGNESETQPIQSHAAGKRHDVFCKLPCCTEVEARFPEVAGGRALISSRGIDRLAARTRRLVSLEKHPAVGCHRM